MAAFDAAQDEVADRHGLRVVEVDDLGPAAGEHVALEVTRQHQQPIDLPRQDELPAFRQFADLHRDSGVRRGIDDRMIERERSEPSRSSTATGSLVASPALNTAASSDIMASGTIVVSASRKGRRRSHPSSRQNTSQKPGRSRAAAGHISVRASSRWRSRSCRGAVRRRPAWARRGLRRCAGRNRRSPASPAMSRYCPWTLITVTRTGTAFERIAGTITSNVSPTPQAAEEILAQIEREPEIVHVDRAKTAARRR